MAKQRGLGKGLSSLIPTAGPGIEENDPTSIPCEELSPNPFQPRREIPAESLEGLIASVKEHGVLQPILVRPTEDGYQIVAGERRWRAAKMIGLKEVPVRILQIDDMQAMEFALVENLQREDLNPIEVAQGIQELITKLSLTHEEVATKIGFSRTAVTNKLRLLQLPLEIIQMIDEEELTEGHARALLSLPSTDKMLDFARLTVQRSLNVRQLEQLVRGQSIASRLEAAFPKREDSASEFQGELDRLYQNYKLKIKVAGNIKNMGIYIKGLKKWQVQLLLEYIERNSEELFPKE